MGTSLTVIRGERSGGANKSTDQDEKSGRDQEERSGRDQDERSGRQIKTRDQEIYTLNSCASTGRCSLRTEEKNAM